MTSHPKGPLRLLRVHVHPDDESSKGAATTAKYVAEGVEVMVTTYTGGERGDILNPALAGDPGILENLPAVRVAETARAREILEIEQMWLGFVGSGLPEGDPPPPLPEGCFALQDVAVAVGRLVKVIRDFRPHVVTTYNERGGYPHSDHVQCHRIAVEAFKAAADSLLWPEYGPAWQAAKPYYHMGLHRRWFAALEALMHEQGLSSSHPVPAHDEDPLSDGRLATSINYAQYFGVRDNALRAHVTQIDPEGPWFAVPLATQRADWSTEDHQPVVSKVPTTVPEDDLFAGLREVPLVPELII